MKFSLIIPVYNVEAYVERCLMSIKNQTYQNYEVIIVNDGSTDQSKNVIKKCIKEEKKFQYYEKENGGLSDARNYGVQYVTGDYILFIDSDDYIEKELLQKLNDCIEKYNFDIVRFEAQLVDDDGTLLSIPKKANLISQKKFEALTFIFSAELIEPAWLYAYKTEFWLHNRFEYAKGKIHEDYGLTPIILDKAKSIGWLNYIGYNYVQRKNSIMNQVDYHKLLKRVGDFKEQFLKHRELIRPNTNESKLILGFSAEALLYKGRELKNPERQDFIQFIKKEHVIDQIYPSTFKKRIQKIYLKLFLEKRLTKLSNEFFQNK